MLRVMMHPATWRPPAKRLKRPWTCSPGTGKKKCTAQTQCVAGLPGRNRRICGEIGLVLASDNAVAIDAATTTLMGLAPDRLGFLQKAAHEGLGSWDMADIRRDGELFFPLALKY